MKTFLTVIGFSVLLTLSSGCAALSEGDPVFPDDHVPAILTVSDFDRIWDNLDTYQGMAVKIAGRIVNSTSTQEGAVVLANWIPYLPHFPLEDGPPDTTHLHLRHYAFLFPGLEGDPFAKGPDYDQQVAWEGNKFVMEGSVEGSRTMVVDVMGKKKTMLLLRAQCIHVWETGESEPSDQPDSQWQVKLPEHFVLARTHNGRIQRVQRVYRLGCFELVFSLYSWSDRFNFLAS